MVGRRLEFIFAGALVAITACASSSGGADDRPIAIPGVEQGDGAATPATTTTATTATTAIIPVPPTTSTSATTATSTPTAPSTTTAPSTSSTTSTTPATSTTSTTTTTTVPELDVFDPLCVVRIQSGDSLGLIAERFDDPTVTASSLQAENGIDDADAINAGSLLDVCVDNGLDDITGSERVEPSESIEAAARRVVVEAQQTTLNELFAGHGIRELLVDGVSGPVTRQRLCAARVALGIPVSRDHMEAGSLEEVALMSADALPSPPSSALQSDRWALVDRTCQIMFVGAGPDSLAFVFSTSTGEAGHETRDQDRSEAFRYDPALENGGWHNSTTFPVAIDNPLNGNMYRPIYFDGGQAIHGSNNVPTTPQSKGCMRLRVADQDALVAWLGLDGLGAPTWSGNRIDLRVNVQGAYVPS
jgi:hypothetical protein